MENRFGPWQPNIAASERLARLRSLRAIVMGVARWDQKLQEKLSEPKPWQPMIWTPLSSLSKHPPH